MDSYKQELESIKEYRHFEQIFEGIAETLSQLVAEGIQTVTTLEAQESVAAASKKATHTHTHIHIHTHTHTHTHTHKQ
jgi:hypothetical protein